ncbi:hypothetical protein [Nocardia sp. NPDC004604]|uniref:hypothetical protein n=1 Tax=Nocardia sp. NPDC004604 TaxID=3157013 RepID=UPI0033B3D4FA
MIAKLLTGHLFDPRELFGMLERVVMARWQLLIVGALAVALVYWVLLRWVRRWREREAADAVWLRIETPATVVAGDAGVFARRVAGVLHRTRRFGFRARHIVLEIHATAQSAQIGVWVPPGVDRAQIGAAITGAWPGAVITHTAPALLVRDHRVVAMEVTARNGVWAPWIDPRATGRTTQRAGVTDPDPLGGVLEQLSTRAEGETGFVQLVLGTYYRRTVPRLVGKAVAAGLSELLGLVRFAISGTTTTAARTGPAPTLSPLAVARQQAAQAKQVAGPHFTATLRVGVSSAEPLPHGRALVAAIAGGFDAVADCADSGGLVTRRTRNRVYRVSVRRPGRAFVATPAEVAALWHLPADAARYELPVVRARSRTARPGLRLPGCTTPQAEHRNPSLRLPRPDKETLRDH